MGAEVSSVECGPDLPVRFSEPFTSATRGLTGGIDEAFVWRLYNLKKKRETQFPTNELTCDHSNEFSHWLFQVIGRSLAL